MSGRHRIYDGFDIPSGVVRMVTAICADYERREHEIKYSAAVGKVLCRHVELNTAVEDALRDIEPGLREAMLHDVAQGVGYNRSSVCAVVSKNAYYRRRRKLVHDIAVKLSLL